MRVFAAPSQGPPLPEKPQRVRSALAYHSASNKENLFASDGLGLDPSPGRASSVSILEEERDNVADATAVVRKQRKLIRDRARELQEARKTWVQDMQNLEREVPPEQFAACKKAMLKVKKILEAEAVRLNREAEEIRKLQRVVKLRAERIQLVEDTLSGVDDLSVLSDSPVAGPAPFRGASSSSAQPHSGATPHLQSLDRRMHSIEAKMLSLLQAISEVCLLPLVQRFPPPLLIGQWQGVIYI